MRLLLRCDGGPDIGVGHVVRSLALAEEATARGHEVALLGRVEGPFLTALAASVGPGLTLLGPSPSDLPEDLARAAAGFDAFTTRRLSSSNAACLSMLMSITRKPSFSPRRMAMIRWEGHCASGSLNSK